MKVVKPLGIQGGPIGGTVPVPLSLERQAEKGMDLAQAVAERDSLVDQKKAHAKADQELIDEVDERISAIAKNIREGMEDRLQRDLKFEDTQALAAVAAHAGEPKPSDPHPFDGKRKECGICGAERKDPIHGEAAHDFSGDEPPDPIIRTHAAIDRPAGNGGGNGADHFNDELDGDDPQAAAAGDPKRAKVLQRKARGKGKAARS